MRGNASLRVLLTLVAAGLAAGAGAQPATQDIRIGPPPVQYNFAPPGARSLAMGASFIGLADDATASASNPAGLTILTKPEVSAHFRYSAFDNQAPDTVLGRGFDTFTDYVGSPSFASFVYPWKNASVALSYQRSADFRSHSFFDGVIPGTVLPNYDQVRTEFRVENIGVSGAFKLGSKISIGASALATRVHLNALQSTTFPDSEFGVLFRGQADLDQSQSKFTFNAGVLVTPVSKVSLGAVYKKGENFDFTQNFAVTVSDGVDSVDITRRTQAVPVRIPDVFGGGLAVRPTENWVVSADVVRVAYSDADLGAGSENLYQSNGEGGREALADATEIHVGTEYTFPVGSDWLLAVRAGFYTDPDHDGLAGLNSDQTHVTIGGGVVVKNRVQLDVAGNFADFIKEGLLSVVVRF